ncbi:MAG: hypothetical protein DLM70_14600 [Chloroflexi bacterium]|nr:MAG: hypothetical protein DLM70_14600 [Chloroflexota bacterium]
MSRGIQVGAQVVGEIALDLERVRGEGGPASPCLVLPVTVSMHSRDASQALAVTNLVCTLYSGEIIPAYQVGQPVTFDLMGGLPVRSTRFAPNPHCMEISFPLSTSLIHRLEDRRHRTEDKAFFGHLTVSGTVAWLVASGGEAPGNRSMKPIPGYAFDSNLGICFILAPFQETRVDTIVVRVSASTWIDHVLPGLGLDHVRLVEISLPRSGGALPEAIGPFFDGARRDYDAGRYRECVQKCRDVRYAVEKHVGATAQRPVGEAIQDRVGWPLAEAERRFLNQCWRALADFTSASHHQHAFFAADANACLLLSAVLLEFLQNLVVAPPAGDGSGVLP